MSQLLNDEALVDDMAAALLALRRWLMQVGEQYEGLSAAPLDDLLRRYEVETGRKPPGWDGGRC